MNKSLNIIKYLALATIFLTPFIVLIVSSNMFFPFITGKNFTFRIMVEVITALWLVLMIFDKRYRPAKGWIFWMFLALLGSMVLSSFFGVNFYKSFWSNYERMEGLVTYLHLFAYFAAMTGLMKTEKIWNFFLNTTVGVSVIVSVYGALQLSGSLPTHQGNRLDATLGNATYLAIYLVIHIFLAMILYFRQKGNFKWAYLPVIILESVALYYTATRGAILGAIGGLLISFVLIVITSRSKKLKMGGIYVIAAVLVLAASFWFARDSQFVKNSPVLNRFSAISVTETTTESRLTIWKMSWSGFKEKPFFGWGPENYNLIFNKYYEPILWKQEPWFDRAHNVFFDRLTMNGMIGLLAYLGLFGSGVFVAWRKRKNSNFSITDASLITGMFAAYFFHNLFVFDNIISWIMFATILAYIQSRSSPRGEAGAALLNRETIPQDKDFEFGKSVAAVIAGGSFAFLIYFINIPPILASKSIIDGFKSAATNQQVALESFQKSINYGTFGSMEAREHLSSFAMNVYDQQAVDLQIRENIMNYAIEEMKKQNKEYPDDIRELIFLASLYNKKKDYNSAVEILNKAIAISPKKQQLYFELGSSYLNSKQYDKGLETLEKSFELDTEFGDARKIYAVAAIFASQDKLAEELMKDHGGTVIADERFLRAYAQRNDYNKVVGILNLFIEQEPGNPQYKLNLAATYLQAGKRTLAIEQIQKVIDTNPSFKEQGEFYISEIKAGRNP